RSFCRFTVSVGVMTLQNTCVVHCFIPSSINLSNKMSSSCCRYHLRYLPSRSLPRRVRPRGGCRSPSMSHRPQKRRCEYSTPCRLRRCVQAAGSHPETFCIALMLQYATEPIQAHQTRRQACLSERAERGSRALSIPAIHFLSTERSTKRSRRQWCSTPVLQRISPRRRAPSQTFRRSSCTRRSRWIR